MSNENIIQGPSTETYSPAPQESEFARAYRKRLPEIQAVLDEELVALNFDLQAAVATALGALPEIRALNEEIHTLGGLKVALADGLEEYAEAAGEAHALYLAAMTPSEDIVVLNETAIHLREILRSDATALATRGLLDRANFTRFTGSTGYRNVGFELSGWAAVMQAAWPRIAGKTALTEEEIANAKTVGEKLVREAGIREQAPATVAVTAKIRQQAATILLRSYEEVRRAIQFVRFHEHDLETIAPSLYAQQRSRKSPEKPAPDQPANNPEPGTTTAPFAPSPGAPAPTAVVPQGMPGARPFSAN